MYCFARIQVTASKRLFVVIICDHPENLLLLHKRPTSKHNIINKIYLKSKALSWVNKQKTKTTISTTVEHSKMPPKSLNKKLLLINVLLLFQKSNIEEYKNINKNFIFGHKIFLNFLEHKKNEN